MLLSMVLSLPFSQCSPTWGFFQSTKNKTKTIITSYKTLSYATTVFRNRVTVLIIPAFLWIEVSVYMHTLLGSLVPRLLFAEWTGKIRSGNETTSLGAIMGSVIFCTTINSLESSPGSLFVCNQYAISWPTGRTLISPYNIMEMFTSLTTGLSGWRPQRYSGHRYLRVNNLNNLHHTSWTLQPRGAPRETRVFVLCEEGSSGAFKGWSPHDYLN